MRITAVVVMVLLLATGAAAADVKYTMEMQVGPGMPPMRSIVYVKGPTERRDINMMGMGDVSTITNCEQKKIITMNSKCQMYYAGDMDEPAPSTAPAAGRAEPARKGGVVKIHNEARDTGERKQLFGHQARHIIVKTTMEAGQGACAPLGRTEISNDMWVIDMQAQAACTPKMGEVPMMPDRGGCRDKYEVSSTGSALGGLPVKTAMTVTTGQGQVQTMNMEIKELSTAPLDASLFQPPAGFKPAKSAQEVMTCGMGMGGAMSSMAEAMRQAQRESRQKQAESGEAAASPAAGEQRREAAAGPAAGEQRRAGVLLVGVVATDKSSKLDPASVAAEIVEKIKSRDGYDAIRLEATNPADAQKEAADKHADFILYVDVTEAKTAMPRMRGILGRATGVGGNLQPTQSVKMEYKLTTVQGQDVGQETMQASEQGGSMEAATGKVTDRTAERVPQDIRKFRKQ